MNRQLLIYPLLTLFLFSFFPNINAQWVNYPQHGSSLAAAVEGNAIWQVSANGLLKRDLNGNLLEEHIFDRFAIGSTRYYLGSTTDMTIDAAGNKWLSLGQTNSSYQALVRFDGTDWTVFPRADIVGSPGSYIYNIEATPDGKVYADNYKELLQFDGTAWSIVPNNPVPSGTTRDMATSSTGEVAIAYDRHVLTYSPTDGWNIVYDPNLQQGFGYFGGIAYNSQDELHVVYYTGEVYKLTNGTATLVTTSPTSLSYITDADFAPNGDLL